MNDGSREGWMHEALKLKAEISARSASNEEKQQQIDILEEGLRIAKAEAARWRRIAEFRHGAESLPGDPGE